MHSFIQPVASRFSESADQQKALFMKAYLKNKFEFIGIQAPERRNICKDYMKQHKPKDKKELEIIVKELWMLPEREFQYFAVELLADNKRLWQPEIIQLFEYCLTNKSWWDTVDFIATECTGRYFKTYPEQTIPVTGRWNNSSDMWLQRSSLLFQKSYKHDTDTGLLSAYILNVSSSKEFFVQKAIGWILREYAKTNRLWVEEFVNAHSLPPLSKREAMKHF